MSFLYGIFNFLGNFGSSITNWVSKFAGEAVGAVTGEVLKGAVAGAVIGAATAAISGEDIKKGALYGAAAGGIAGGVSGMVGQSTSTGVETKTPVEMESADITMQEQPVPAVDPISQMANQSDLSFASQRNAAPTMPQIQPDISPPRTPVSSKPAPSATEKSTDWLGGMSDSKAKLLAGIGQGVATGGLGYLSAQAQSKDAKEAEERRAVREEAAEERRATREKEAEERKYARQDEVRNRFAIGKRPVRQYDKNVVIKSWWKKHLNPETNLIQMPEA